MKALSLKETISDLSPKSNERRQYLLNASKFRLKLGVKTAIMGIVNLTPDSFSNDGLILKDESAILEHIDRLIEDGSDIIDIGGESTRPGAKPISLKEEISRVMPIIKKASKRINVPMSIDTYKSEVARQALNEGASIVNDIMGLRGDSSMAKVVSEFRAPIVLMHIKGRPHNMQANPQYKCVIAEIAAELRKSILKAREFGINNDKIIIDPGIGFGKTTEHNLEIINRLEELKMLDRPILMGVSRKSFIGNVLGVPPEERLIGTAAAVALAIKNGAHIVRVHDVKQMAQVAKMIDAIINRD